MRYRLRWAKRGKLRFLSHHDEALVFERAARRGELPVSYSRGFTPHPKIAFGSGLPVGFGSEVELLDVALEEPMPSEEIVERFNRGLPFDLRVLAVVALPDGVVSLGALIVAADYEIRCVAPWLSPGLKRFMQLESYKIEKPYKGGFRTDDLRKGVLQARLLDDGIAMRCAIKPRSIRPSDVMAAIAQLMQEPEPAARYQRVALLTRTEEDLVLLDEHHVSVKVD